MKLETKNKSAPFSILQATFKYQDGSPMKGSTDIILSSREGTKVIKGGPDMGESSVSLGYISAGPYNVKIKNDYAQTKELEIHIPRNTTVTKTFVLEKN